MHMPAKNTKSSAALGCGLLANARSEMWRPVGNWIAEAGKQLVY